MIHKELYPRRNAKPEILIFWFCYGFRMDVEICKNWFQDYNQNKHNWNMIIESFKKTTYRMRKKS